MFSDVILIMNFGMVGVKFSILDDFGHLWPAIHFRPLLWVIFETPQLLFSALQLCFRFFSALSFGGGQDGGMPRQTQSATIATAVIQGRFQPQQNTTKTYADCFNSSTHVSMEKI